MKKAAQEINRSVLDIAQRFSLHPIVAMGAVILGVLAGKFMPDGGVLVKPLMSIYIDILSLVMFPMIICYLTIGLHKGLQDKRSVHLFMKLFTAVAGLVLVASLTSMAILEIFSSVYPLTENSLLQLSKYLANGEGGGLTAIEYSAGTEAQSRTTATSWFTESLVPNNVFSALAGGSLLQGIIISFLFAFGLTGIPPRLAETIVEPIDAVFNMCVELVRWITVLNPLIIFAIVASQMTSTGISIIDILVQYAIKLLIVAMVVATLLIMVIGRRSGLNVVDALRAVKNPLMVAIATSNVGVCLPQIIESLCEKLQYSHPRVSTVLPLAVAFSRVGIVIYLVASVSFLSEMQQEPLQLPQLVTVALVCAAVGIAAAGLEGLLVVSTIATAGNFIGLTSDGFQLAFIAMEVICGPIRAVLNVLGVTAVVSLICPKPLKI